MRALTVALLFLLPFSLYASARSNSGGLAERVAELEAQVEELTAALQDAQEILQFVHVETGKINGLTGPHWIIEGANVHVRSGIGKTYYLLCPAGSPGSCVSSNDLGNLIVGYNELPPSQPAPRNGMHQLIVGAEHVYDSAGGFVAGRRNSIFNEGTSVTGGTDNQAFGSNASVSGGSENLVTGASASISGGFRNVASGGFSSVSGGEDRETPDKFNWAAGNLFEAN